MKRSILLLVCCFLVSIISEQIFAQWQQTSCPTYGVESLAISGPNIFNGTYKGGVFLSKNNGTRWSAVNNGLMGIENVMSLAISGSNIFAGTEEGVFLSKNNGTSWSAVNNGLTNTYVGSLAISGSYIFAGTDGGVFLSTNNGTNWSLMSKSMPNLTNVFSLAISDSNIFAGTSEGGIFLSTNNGISWSAVNNGLTDLLITAIAISDSDIFAGTWVKGVFLSKNNGTNWTAGNNGLTDLSIEALAISGSNIFAGIYNGGVYLSSDTGSTWTDVSNGLTGNALFVYSLAINGSYIFAGTYEGVWKRALSDFSCTPPSTVSVTPSDTTGICSGDSTTYTVTAGSGTAPFAYQWLNNNVQINGATDSTYSAKVSGIYSCVVSNICNIVDTSNTATLIVNTNTTTGIIGTATACNSVILIASATNASSYSWSGGSSTTIAANTFTSSGTYTVTVTDKNGCTATASQSVTLNSNTTTGISGIAIACDSVSLTASANGSTSYLWNGGKYLNDSTNTFTSSDTYTVTVTDNNGCTGTASQGVKVNTNTTTGISGTTIACDSVSLTASANGGTSYLWNGGKYLTDSTNTFTSSGTYTVTVTDNNGCTGIDSVSVVVNTNTTTGITGTAIACDSVSLTASASGGISYVWNSGKYLIDSTNTFISSGTYTVTVTDNNGCTGTASKVVVVNPSSVPNISGDTTTCTGSQRIMYNTDNGMSNYIWSVSGGHITTNNGSMILVFWTAEGRDTVKVTYTGANGCSGTTSYSVFVKPTPATPTITLEGNELISSAKTGNQWYDTNGPIAGDTSSTFTPSWGGCDYVIVTKNGCSSLPSNTNPCPLGGINTLTENNAFNLYPNPNDGSFIIELTGYSGGICILGIWDMFGNRVFEQMVNIPGSKFLQSVNVANLANGIYSLKLSNVNVQFKRVFIIQK